MRKLLLFLLLSAVPAGALWAAPYEVKSPNGEISVTVDIADRITYTVRAGGTTLMERNAISLRVGGTVLVNRRN